MATAPAQAGADRAAGDPRRRAIAMAIAVAIVLLAAVLRLATLGAWSVWIDEAFTLHDATHHPPPYFVSYALTRAVVSVLGDGERALRLVPCLAGIATVALLLLARPVANEHPRAPQVAALVLAVLPWHLFMSQNARHYSLQAGCVLVAFLAADGRLCAARRPRPLAAAMALAVAVGCHPTAIFFVPGLLLVALRRLPHARAATALVASLVALTAVAAYLPLAGGYIAAKGASSTWQLVASFGFLAGPTLLLCALAGALVPPRASAELLLLLPTALVYLAASRLVFVSGYHAFAAVPVVVLLASRGLLLTSRRTGLLLGAALVAGIAAGLWLYHTGHGLRPRFREASAWLAAASADGCRLFATQPPAVAYHLGERDELRDPDRVAWLQPWTVAELQAALAAGPVAVLVHGDDLHGFGEAERAALDALLARLPVTVTFAAGYGPKDCTLRVWRTGG